MAVRCSTYHYRPTSIPPNFIQPNQHLDSAEVRILYAVTRRPVIEKTSAIEKTSVMERTSGDDLGCIATQTFLTKTVQFNFYNVTLPLVQHSINTASTQHQHSINTALFSSIIKSIQISSVIQTLRMFTW